MDELSREQKILIFAAATLDELVKAGFVIGPILLPEKGRKEYEKLIAEGFEPTSEEIKVAALYLMSSCGEE